MKIIIVDNGLDSDAYCSHSLQTGVFRHIILELMPVETLSGHFDPAMGRPTKELYSMAGLLLIKEFMNWTKEEALDAYSFRMDIHYALNLEPVTHDLSMRTLERYMDLFEKDELARALSYSRRH